MESPTGGDLFFALLAFKNDLTAVLHTFEDLPSFCTKLDIPSLDITNRDPENPAPLT